MNSVHMFPLFFDYINFPIPQPFSFSAVAWPYHIALTIPTPQVPITFISSLAHSHLTCSLSPHLLTLTTLAHSHHTCSLSPHLLTLATLAHSHHTYSLSLHLLTTVYLACSAPAAPAFILACSQ